MGSRARTAMVVSTIFVAMYSMASVYSSTWSCTFTGCTDQTIDVDEVTSWKDFAVWNSGWRSANNIVEQTFSWSLGVVEKYSTYGSCSPDITITGEYGNAGSVYYQQRSSWPSESWPGDGNSEWCYYGIKLKGVATGSRTISVYAYRSTNGGTSWTYIGSSSFTITVE